VRDAAFSIVGQCLFYHHCAPVIVRLYPGLTFGAGDVPALTRHITEFSLAGLEALAAGKEWREQ
jgi:hypothetical protein